MKKQGCYFLVLCLLTMILTACMSSMLTSADLVYNRHSVYKKISDIKLNAIVHHLLFWDALFKQAESVLDVTVFNGDVLVAGHLPTAFLRSELKLRLKNLRDYRAIYIQVSVGIYPNSNMEDTWITAKIRSHIIADSSINPADFKIITVDRVVYVMGNVIPTEAWQVLAIARKTEGVVRVVKLLKYYHLTNKDKIVAKNL